MAEPHAKDACGKAERAPEKREIEKPCESCVRNLLNASREVREGNFVAKAVRPWREGIQTLTQPVGLRESRPG